jgi:hypothetical protein
MDADAILEWLTNHLTELILIVGGVIAVFVVFLYLKDKNSTKYKFAMFLGFAVGVAMIYAAAAGWSALNLATAVIVLVGGFALIIRPFQDVHFAALLALFVMILSYILLGSLDGSVLWKIDVSFLAYGWPRIIVAVIIGAIVYMITNFGEELIKVFGKILNWWPLLFILGLLCIAEGVSIAMGYGSLYDLYLEYSVNTENIISFM